MNLTRRWLAVGITVCGLVVSSILSLNDNDTATGWLLGTVTSVVIFYFGEARNK